MEKTNVMRILDSKKIEYGAFEYDPTLVDGLAVAHSLGQDETKVFKTLVTVGADKRYYVFVIPVCAQLNLKKSAKSVGVKAVEMIKLKELLPLTGYVHGGCSPIGMKKPFVTVIDEMATLCDKIICSAGKVGYQIEVEPQTLASFVGASFCDITE
ncbi:MAG: Cys-tRNA(Pro) deacylase [Clostridia bacterium]